jgi:hypothetical protein
MLQSWFDEMNSLVWQSMVLYIYHLQLYILIYKFILHAPAIRPGAGMQPAARRGMQPAARACDGGCRKTGRGKNAKTCDKYMYFSKKTDYRESKSYNSNVSAFGVLL